MNIDLLRNLFRARQGAAGMAKMLSAMAAEALDSITDVGISFDLEKRRKRRCPLSTSEPLEAAGGTEMIWIDLNLQPFGQIERFVGDAKSNGEDHHIEGLFNPCLGLVRITDQKATRLFHRKDLCDSRFNEPDTRLVPGRL